MRYLLAIIMSLFITTGFFHSCNNEEVNSGSNVNGYIEYQYDYTVQISGETVKKQGYKRAIINQALLKIELVNNLPDSLVVNFGHPDSIASKFRKVELYIFSPQFNIDSIDKPMIQPLGASIAHFTLIDSLALFDQDNSLLPFEYVIDDYSTLQNNLRPLCVEFNVNMNLVVDTLSDQNIYEFVISGQKSKKLNVFKIGNNQYQIMASGLSNSKIYNLYYTGPIITNIN